MRPPSPELLLESLAEALQTMAFISPEPAAETPAVPPQAQGVSIRWKESSGRTGELTFATSRIFGELLAANILALEPGTPEVAQRAVDALQELCNITTGSLLARLCETPDETPEMGLPEVHPLEGDAAWNEFVARPGTTAILAEGYPLAIRVEETAL